MRAPQLKWQHTKYGLVFAEHKNRVTHLKVLITPVGSQFNQFNVVVTTADNKILFEDFTDNLLIAKLQAELQMLKLFMEVLDE